MSDTCQQNIIGKHKMDVWQKDCLGNYRAKELGYLVHYNEVKRRYKTIIGHLSNPDGGTSDAICTLVGC